MIRSVRPILVVASKGGHWVQLLRLRRVWEGEPVVYMSNDASLEQHVHPAPFELVNDASMDDKFALLLLAVVMFFRIAWLRPRVVISTGAAPGFFALLWGKLFGAKTIWVDSIANAEEMSLAGKKVKRFADVWLTQWPEVAKAGGPEYQGSVL